MTVRVGINGFGRIGRNFFRAVQASGADIEIVGVNDLTDTKTLAHLLKYDSVHGRFAGDVSVRRRRRSRVGGKTITVFAERDPADLPWGDARRRRRRRVHRLLHRRHQGAARTSTPAPRRSSSPRRPPTRTSPSSWASTTTTTTRRSTTIISNASCTTNCLAPMAKVLHDEFGIVKGLMTTIHAYTARPEPAGRPAQGPAPRPRRRASTSSRPRTGAAKAIGLVMPELKGKLDGYALRVPDPRRLRHRPHRRGRPRDHRRGGQRRSSRPRPRARSRAS